MRKERDDYNFLISLQKQGKRDRNAQKRERERQEKKRNERIIRRIKRRRKKVKKKKEGLNAGKFNSYLMLLFGLPFIKARKSLPFS